MKEQADATSAPSLGDRTFLIVEDESIISFLIEDMLQTLGCSTVMHAGNVKQAFAALKEQRPDAAVLDVNLSGESAFPIAESLEADGIPFVFATGYGAGGLPARWTGRPVIQKPFTLESLEKVLRSAF